MISTITAQGLVMGENTPYTIHKASGFPSPRTEVARYPNSGRHGIKISRALWRERLIRLEISMRASSVNAYADLRSEFLKAWNLPEADDNVTIYFTTKDGKNLLFQAQIYNEIDGDFNPGELTTGKMRVELIVENNKFESQTENSQTLFLPVSSGVAIPTAIPISFTKTGGSTIVNNAGNGNAFPVVTIYGPVTNPRIYSSALDKFIAINVALLSTDYLEIDMINETVLLNGTGSKLDNTTGEFWWLKPGSNEIQYTADSYNALSYTLIKWRDSYSGI